MHWYISINAYVCFMFFLFFLNFLLEFNLPTFSITPVFYVFNSTRFLYRWPHLLLTTILRTEIRRIFTDMIQPENSWIEIWTQAYLIPQTMIFPLYHMSNRKKLQNQICVYKHINYEILYKDIWLWLGWLTGIKFFGNIHFFRIFSNFLFYQGT